MSCIGCKYYDESVDCCNADENCYQVGIQKFADWLAKNNVISSSAKNELIRDFNGERYADPEN